MSDLNEKPTFGATIIRKEQQSDTILPPQPTHLPLHKPSFASISPCSTNTAIDPPKIEEHHPTSNNPFSAFYNHPRTRTSFEQMKSESNLHLPLYAHDLESGSKITQVSVADTVQEPAVRSYRDSKVWPCSRTKEKTLLEKQQKSRGCYPYNRLSRKQKFWFQAVLALLIIGAFTGLGLGITKAVGGGVFKNSNDSSAPISSR